MYVARETFASKHVHIVVIYALYLFIYAYNFLWRGSRSLGIVTVCNKGCQINSD